MLRCALVAREPVESISTLYGPVVSITFSVVFFYAAEYIKEEYCGITVASDIGQYSHVSHSYHVLCNGIVVH